MVGRSFKFDALWSKSLLSNLTRHVLCESEARSSTDITTWNSTSSNRNLLFRFKRVFCMCATPNQLAYMNKSLFFSPYFVIVISSFPFSSVSFYFVPSLSSRSSRKSIQLRSLQTVTFVAALESGLLRNYLNSGLLI